MEDRFLHSCSTPNSLGLIVEGDNDKLSYEMIFKRIKPELYIKTLVLHGRDKKTLKDIFKILNKKLQGSNHSGVKKGLIICDCDETCAPERAGFIKEAIKKESDLPNTYHKIKIHATCKELETLFLTCIEDVKIINGQSVNFKQIKNIENIPDHKKRLSELLLKEKIIYGNEVAKEIASQINIETLKERLKNFNRLHQIINNL